MALTCIDLRGRAAPFHELLPRPADPGADVRDVVAGIIDQVRRGGDTALHQLTRRFDGVDVATTLVDPEALPRARRDVGAELAGALELAYRRICEYHAFDAVVPQGELTSDGVTVQPLVRPISRAGIYAPGGRARYPSTVLMCAGPARVAGVADVVLCVPPGPSGQVDDATLAAADIAGITEVHAVGGAQAVAAMAYGTAAIRPVDVVVGPGNRYVAEAMRQVGGVVGVAAAFAGPSEVVVIAGPETPPELAAIDLAVQAEHGPDGAAWLVTWDAPLADAVEAELVRIVERSPRRADLESTLRRGGFRCLVDTPEDAVAVANEVAPEHLELMTQDAAALLPLVWSAGAVFLGATSPASIGDYLAGPNHVLPTDRTARFASALRADDFRRHLHAVTVSPEGLRRLGPAVVTLATSEGLSAHADSVRMRL